MIPYFLRDIIGLTEAIFGRNSKNPLKIEEEKSRYRYSLDYICEEC